VTAKLHSQSRRTYHRTTKASRHFKHGSYAAVAARGEIGREGCEISSLVEHMGLSPWLFL